MIVTKRHIPRRTVLQGAGAALALPMLDAMVPAFVSAAKPVRRFLAVYIPMGVAMPDWTPRSVGPLDLAPIQQPLAAFRDRMLVVSGLDSAQAIVNDAGFHPRAQATWLTGVRPKRTEGIDYQAGISMDQVVAGEFGKETQLASLELALEDVNTLNGACTIAGYSCIYSNTVSWRTSTMPLPMEASPRAVFERLFGVAESTGAAVRRAQLERDASLLDVVNAKIARLAKSLGPRDRRKLDEYLDSVRDVERRIQKAETQVDLEMPVVVRPTGTPELFEEHAKLMFDLLTLAYKTDMTRVSTFLYGREGSLRTFPEIGVSDSWHPLSHHVNNQEKLARQAKLNAYHTRMLAYFLDKLQSTEEGDGSLLDNTLVFYGSGMSDSNLHVQLDLPTVVVSGRRIDVTPDRHVKCAAGTPLANLQLSLLGKLGIPETRFGDSSGQLRELTGI
ncbi:MAG: DUF1552 domain-containing protein [Vicinamibacterales bacterium]